MILVVAATARELEFVAAPRPSSAASARSRPRRRLRSALAAGRPRALLHIGIAGAQTLEPPALVLGSEAVYCRRARPQSTFPRIDRAEPDPGAARRARAACFPRRYVLPIATSARVGGGGVCEVEAMEGFGVLRAAALAGVPALELRAVSNAVGEADRELWRIDDALADACRQCPEADRGVRCLSCRLRCRRRRGPWASSSPRRSAPTGRTSGASLPLGLPLAVMAQVIYGYGFTTQVELLCLAAPLTSAAYLAAVLARVRRSGRRRTFSFARISAASCLAAGPDPVAPLHPAGGRVARVLRARRAGDRARSSSGSGTRCSRPWPGDGRLRARAGIARTPGDGVRALGGLFSACSCRGKGRTRCASRASWPTSF